MRRVWVWILVVFAVALSGAPAVAMEPEGAGLGGEEGTLHLSPPVAVGAHETFGFELGSCHGQGQALDVVVYRVMSDSSLIEVFSRTATTGEELRLPSSGSYRLGVYTPNFVEWGYPQYGESRVDWMPTICPVRLKVEPQRVQVDQEIHITVEWAPSSEVSWVHWELYVLNETQWSRSVDWLASSPSKSDLNVVAFDAPRQGDVLLIWTEYDEFGEILTLGTVTVPLVVVSPPTATPTVTLTPTATPTSTSTPTPTVLVPTVTPEPTIVEPTTTPEPTIVAPTATLESTATPTMEPTIVPPTATPTKEPTNTLEPTATLTIKQNNVWLPMVCR